MGIDLLIVVIGGHTAGLFEGVRCGPSIDRAISTSLEAELGDYCYFEDKYVKTNRRQASRVRTYV